MANISKIKLPNNTTYDIKDAVARGVKMYYGTCTTAAATAAKVVSVSADQDFKLTVGALVMVKFSETNTASNVTLNVNSTGAKSIYYANVVYTSTSSTACGYANTHNVYMYNGSYWVWVGHGSDSNTTYSAMSVAEGKTATATSSRTMRSDYLKQIIQYHAVPSGQGVPAGGTAGQILAKVDGTNYNTGWIDAPSGGDDVFYYVATRRNHPTPKPSDFVYPGDVDLEFVLHAQTWSLVSADMKALFPSVDLPPSYYYKQKKITNSAGTYLYKMARWEYESYTGYIEFRNIANHGWKVKDMSIPIGSLSSITWAMTSDANLASCIKAVYGKGDYLTGLLNITASVGGSQETVPVTGIVRSATEFEFQTYVKNRNDNKMYLVNAFYNAGTWTITKVEVGTLA